MTTAARPDDTLSRRLVGGHGRRLVRTTAARETDERSSPTIALGGPTADTDVDPAAGTADRDRPRTPERLSPSDGTTGRATTAVAPDPRP